MKTINKVLATVLSILLALSVTACGEDKLSLEARNIRGSRAYIHDKETPVAVFRKNGAAEYEGKKYSFTCDSQFI